jgi:hypothetical protein
VDNLRHRRLLQEETLELQPDDPRRERLLAIRRAYARTVEQSQKRFLAVRFGRVVRGFV